MSIIDRVRINNELSSMKYKASTLMTARNCGTTWLIKALADIHTGEFKGTLDDYCDEFIAKDGVIDRARNKSSSDTIKP